MIEHYGGQFRAVAEIFSGAIHQVAKSAYTLEEIAAWAPMPIDYEHWRVRCEFKRPFLFVEDGHILGFIELDSDGHIDCHYVHPDYNRQGIGGALLEHAIAVATSFGVNRLHVEASHIAKGLYLKHGFQTVQANKVRRLGVTLANWIMERTIECN